MADESWRNTISVIENKVENAVTAVISVMVPIDTMVSSIGTYYEAPRRRRKPKALKKAVEVVKLDLRARKIRLED